MEEMIAAADLRDPQHLAPEPGQGRLEPLARAFVGGLVHTGRELGNVPAQPGPVDLAVRQQRQSVEEHETATAPCSRAGAGTGARGAPG